MSNLAVNEFFSFFPFVSILSLLLLLKINPVYSALRMHVIL